MGRPNKYGTVVAELPRRGKYRVRVIQMDDGSEKIDVREYVETDRYTGWSKNGIRLTKMELFALTGDLAKRDESASDAA